jgi:glycosyltransferase involved in cell wall biosynthesis
VALELSIVVPMHNEAGNVVRLAHEIAASLAPGSFEVLLVDDGSTDATLAEALRLRGTIAELRVLGHTQRLGQSAAIWSGVRAARAPWVVTLDGDGQNDPSDIGELLKARSDAGDESVRLVVGHRTRRRDTAWRRLQSRIANGVRGRFLGDDTPDTGCGLKLFARDTFLALPSFTHMHRFLPALFLREGARVISIPVHHRPRTAGRSKYAMLDRLAAGLVDLAGVFWLMRRGWPKDLARELTGAAAADRIEPAGVGTDALGAVRAYRDLPFAPRRGSVPRHRTRGRRAPLAH